MTETSRQVRRAAARAKAKREASYRRTALLATKRRQRGLAAARRFMDEPGDLEPRVFEAIDAHQEGSA